MRADLISNLKYGAEGAVPNKEQTEVVSLNLLQTSYFFDE